MKKHLMVLNIILLVAMSLLSTSSRAADDNIFPQRGFGAGIEAGSGGPASLLYRVQLIVFKGGRQEVAVEPAYYFLRTDGDIGIATLSRTNKDVSYLNLDFALAGVRVHEGDTAASGELGHVVLMRNYRVNENTVVRVTAINTMARAMLPVWKKPASHDLWVELKLDALGYKTVSYVRSFSSFHGLDVGRIGTEIGATFYPERQIPVRLVFGADAGLAFNFSGRVQNDFDAYSAIRINFSQAVKAFIQAGWLASRDSGTGTFTQARQIIGGAIVLF